MDAPPDELVPVADDAAEAVVAVVDLHDIPWA